MNIFKYKNQIKKGFTLIELLIVIGIIALLATIVLGNLRVGMARARDAKRLQVIRNIQYALIFYYDTCGSYPNTDNLLQAVPIGGDATYIFTGVHPITGANPNCGQNERSGGDGGISSSISHATGTRLLSLDAPSAVYPADGDCSTNDNNFNSNAFQYRSYKNKAEYDKFKLGIPHEAYDPVAHKSDWYSIRFCLGMTTQGFTPGVPHYADPEGLLK